MQLGDLISISLWVTCFTRQIAIKFIFLSLLQQLTVNEADIATKASMTMTAVPTEGQVSE